MIDLWQLHRIDSRTPRDEQFSAVASLIKSRVIAHAGLSEVSVAEIEAAEKHFKVATVQNKYNLGDRASEDVLEFCEKRGIGFIPWFPLAAGELSKPGGALDRIARAHKATPSGVALAWLLKRSPVMLPIPGTSKVSHLEENVAAAEIKLSDARIRRARPRGACGALGGRRLRVARASSMAEAVPAIRAVATAQTFEVLHRRACETPEIPAKGAA